MKNISRQFEELATSFRQSKFKRAALKLALSYVLGVFVVLLVSSGAIYLLTVSVLPPLPEEETQFEQPEIPHDELSLHEFQEHLIDILLIVDASVLVIAALASYIFARRTLKPIEELYAEQEQFVADVAHELRTPLAVFKAGSQSILNKDRAVLEYKEFISELEEETDRLTRLSNDLLYVLKNKTKTSHSFSTINFTNLVQKQINFFEEYATQKQVTLSLNAPTPALTHGDEDSLTRLVQNLLKNAIDYNKADGKVIVTLTTEANKVKLVIKDTGIGIAEENLTRVFNRFYKTDTSRTHSGTGLGLSIVEGIVKMHKGDVALKSTLGEGTVITVTLPAPHFSS